MIYTPTPFCAHFLLVTRLLKSTVAATNQNLSLASAEATSRNLQLAGCEEHTPLGATEFTARCARYHLSEKARHAKTRIIHNTTINTKGIKQSEETLGKFCL